MIINHEKFYIERERLYDLILAYDLKELNHGDIFELSEIQNKINDQVKYLKENFHVNFICDSLKVKTKRAYLKQILNN